MTSVGAGRLAAFMAVAAVAALVAGCGENEAKKFGYKGADLAEEEMMFFSTGPSVTNWVPARVLNVFEDYPISPEESALIKAAGVIANLKDAEDFIKLGASRLGTSRLVKIAKEQG